MRVLRLGRLEQIVIELIEDGIICPQPAVWNRLWLQIKTLVGHAEAVPMPLILAVWHSASDQRKTERFIDQLVIAERYGFADQLADSVASITEENWYRGRHRERSNAMVSGARGTEATVIDRELLTAYLATEFVVSGTSEIVFKVGQRSAALDALLRWHKSERAAFITAFNPFSEARTGPENAQAQASLLRQVEAWGLNWLDGEGRDPTGQWPGEPSVLVLGISESQARELGQHFGQNALVWCQANSSPELVLLR